MSQKVDCGGLGSASSSLNFWPNLLLSSFLLERSKKLLREAEWFSPSLGEVFILDLSSDELSSAAEIKVP